MKAVTEKLSASIRALRTAGGSDYRDVVEWLQESLLDQTLTNEQTVNPNLLMHGQGTSACIREIMQALMK